MALSFSDEKTRCYICGEYIHQDENVFLLQGAKVNSESTNQKDKWISIYKNGSKKFLAHERCQNKILWNMFNPEIKLNDEYFTFLNIGYKNNKKIWKLGNRIIKDKCTQEELNTLIALFAKDLLNGKIKGY